MPNSKSLAHSITWLALAILPLHIASAENPDILGIFDQMVISRAAAELCTKSDGRLMESFQRNFQLVSVRAMEEVRKRRPSMTTEEVANLVSGRELALVSRTREMVSSRGCGDSDIATVSERFEVQARWNPQK